MNAKDSKQKMKFPLPLRFAAGAVIFLVIEYLLYAYVDRYAAVYAELLDVKDKPLIDFFRLITGLGKAIWYLVPFGIATIVCSFVSRGKDVLPRYRRLYGYIGVRAFFLFATIGISGLAADALKPVIGRARPALWLHENIYGFMPFTKMGFLWNGMPSGHSTTVFALAFSLAHIYPRLRIVWLAYALLIAVSRVMVDAHYLSDICAGATLGWFSVYAFTKCGMIHLSKVIFPIDTQVLR